MAKTKSAKPKPVKKPKPGKPPVVTPLDDDPGGNHPPGGPRPPIKP